MSSALKVITYSGNALWFGAAGYWFTLGAGPFVGRHSVGVIHKDKALQIPTIYAVRFLGGMNMAFVLLSLLRLKRVLLRKSKGKDDEAEKDILQACAFAHFTQFFFNISSYMKKLNGKEHELPFRWSWEMMFIYRMDISMSILNYIVSSRITPKH